MSEQHRTSSHDVTPEQVTGASGAPRWIAFAATGACAILLVVGAFIAIGPTSSSDDRPATSDDANADVDPAPIDSSVADDRTSDTAGPESEPAGDSRLRPGPRNLTTG